MVIGLIALITLFSIESKLSQGNKQNEEIIGLLKEIKEKIEYNIILWQEDENN